MSISGMPSWADEGQSRYTKPSNGVKASTASMMDNCASRTKWAQLLEGGVELRQRALQ